MFSTKGDRPLADILSGGGMYITSYGPTCTDHNDQTMTVVCANTLILCDAHYVPDTGDVFWEPSIVNAFRNADLELSRPTPNLDACFEKDTISVDELLDRLKDAPVGDHTPLVSQQLLASIGEPSLFKWCTLVSPSNA